jgi:hypothetical protein
MDGEQLLEGLYSRRAAETPHLVEGTGLELHSRGGGELPSPKGLAQAPHLVEQDGGECPLEGLRSWRGHRRRNPSAASGGGKLDYVRLSYSAVSAIQ